MKIMKTNNLKEKMLSLNIVLLPKHHKCIQMRAMKTLLHQT